MILIALYCCRTQTYYIVVDDFDQNSEELVDHNSGDIVGPSSDGIVRYGDRVVIRGKTGERSLTGCLEEGG